VDTKQLVKVAAFTGGARVPSARFRLRQMIQSLDALDIKVKEFIPVISSYPPRAKLLRPLWGILALLARLPAVVSSYRYDVVFLQREMISTLTTLEKFTNNPKIVDIDDAIWLHKDGRFAQKLVEMSEGTVCGNNFISAWASSYCNNVIVIPTAIDSNRFKPKPEQGNQGGVIIGWSGTSGGFKYLYAIEEALVKLVNARNDIKIRVVSDRPPLFKSLPANKIEFVAWSSEIEVSTIQEMSIGIMPLDDSEWSKGKCSFKMLTYMACGIPVVVSPVGMNADVLAKGKCGFGASNHTEWEEALLLLLGNEHLCSEMGMEGRKIVEENYSIRVVAPKLASFIKTIANRP